MLCEASDVTDLLVLGSRGRNPLAGLMLGSVSRACLHQAQCSVVVVRAGPASARPQGRVLVGIDASSPARRALHIAAVEARLRKAELHVVHAVQWDQLHSPDLIAPATRQLLSWTAGVVADELADSGVEGHPIVVNGNPADMLVRHSTGADLLVVGSRGRNPLATLTLGSTSDYCARHAPCPVMTARPADHEKHGPPQQ